MAQVLGVWGSEFAWVYLKAQVTAEIVWVGIGVGAVCTRKAGEAGKRWGDTGHMVEIQRAHLATDKIKLGKEIWMDQWRRQQSFTFLAVYILHGHSYDAGV